MIIVMRNVRFTFLTAIVQLPSLNGLAKEKFFFSLQIISWLILINVIISELQTFLHTFLLV
jgi:hypothetical protein